MNRAAALAVTIALLRGGPLSAQIPTVRGYYLNVPLWSDSTALAAGGFGDFQRLRFMTAPELGALTFDLAYEHLLSYSERATGALAGALLAGVAPGGGEWLDLDWTLKQTDHWLWRHRIDRLNARFKATDFLEITAGRQTISWATTLFLTPADPFAPFDPADPFREYRAGVDALRLQAYPGPLSELELVARMVDTPIGELLTVLGRGRTTWRGWEVSAWGGALHEDPALGLGATGGIGKVALRGEASFRVDENDDPTFRGTVGLDTRFTVRGRDLYVVVEYQRDGFGAGSARELGAALISEPFARGELQVLGRDVGAAQAAYQLHALAAVDLLILGNLGDPSVLLAPGVTYSASNEVTLRAGLFLGLGDDDFGAAPTTLPSEFGVVPAVLYLSGSAFF